MPIGLNYTDDSWFQGKNRSGAALEKVVISTPSIIGTDQNNYALQKGSTLFRLSSSTIVNISGFVAPVAPYTGVIRLVNVGLNDIRLLHESTLSTSINRILSSTGGDITLVPDGVVDLTYDASSQRWRNGATSNQPKISIGTAIPTGGVDGDIYFQYLE